jgi:hypothetical protein
MIRGSIATARQDEDEAEKVPGKASKFSQQ